MVKDAHCTFLVNTGRRVPTQRPSVGDGWDKLGPHLDNGTRKATERDEADVYL